MSVEKERVSLNLPTERIIAIGIKPGVRASIGDVSYVALTPHRILEINFHKEKFLVEYDLKTEWVSIKELEDRGVIKRLEGLQLEDKSEKKDIEVEIVQENGI